MIPVLEDVGQFTIYIPAKKKTGGQLISDDFEHFIFS